jgi:hypothetical protein
LSEKERRDRNARPHQQVGEAFPVGRIVRKILLSQSLFTWFLICELILLEYISHTKKMASNVAPSDLIQVTCSAPVNIAVVKYWGKRDEDLILPVNSSLSATLHQDQLMTITSVAASKHFDKDRMWLNQKYVML